MVEGRPPLSVRLGAPAGTRGPLLPWLLLVWQVCVTTVWWARYPVVPAVWTGGFRRFFVERHLQPFALLENWLTFLAAAAALVGLLALVRRAGAALVRTASRRGRHATDPLVAHAAGLGAVGLLGMGAGFCGLIAAAPDQWGSAGLAVLGVADVSLDRRAWTRLLREVDLRPGLRPLGPVALAAVGVLAFVTGAHLLGIETGWDAMTYHLRFPSFYLLRHRVFDLWHQLAGSFPQHAEMLFLVARACGGDTLARFLNAFAGLLALAVARRVGERLGGPAGWAGPLLLVSPMVALLLTRCYGDLLTLLWGGCAWLGLLAWRQRGAPAAGLAVGLAAGLAMATKYTAVMLVPALLAAAWPAPPASRRGADSARRSGAVAGLAAAGMLGPWLLRNYLNRGNPVAPFFSGLAGLPQDLSGDLALPFQHVESGSRVLASSLAGRLQALLFDDGRMQGPLGPAFACLLPLLAFGAPGPGAAHEARRGVVVFLGAWLALAPDARFLTPVLPLACAWLGRAAAPWLAIRRWPQRGLQPVLEIGVVCAALYGAGYQWSTDAPFSMPLGFESRQDKLELGLRPAPFLSYAATAIAARVPRHDRVLLATHFTSYYIERECLNDVHFGRARVARFVRAGRTPEGIARVLRQHGIRWILGCGTLSHGFAHIPGFFDAGPRGWESWKRLLATRGEAVWMTNEFTLFRLGAPHASSVLPALPPLDGAIPDDALVADTGAAAARLAAAADASRDFTLAERGWREALRRGLDTPAVRLGLAKALLARDRPAEAAPHVLRALAVHPRSAYARGLLAVILAGAGDRSGARAAIVEAVRLEPGDPEYRRLAKVLGAAP